MQFLAAILCLAVVSCGRPEPQVPLSSSFPIAVEPAKVGSYPALTKSGGGYFYDEVLEYRVWVHPGGDDYYRAFPTYEAAQSFSKKQKDAEEPLVVVLQREHVNEPKPGVFEHVKEERIAEWQVEWLKEAKRGPDSITQFLESRGKQPAHQALPADADKPSR